jgi:hypothetical protein
MPSRLRMGRTAWAVRTTFLQPRRRAPSPAAGVAPGSSAARGSRSAGAGPGPARGRCAAGLVPVAGRVPALFPGILSPPPSPYPTATPRQAKSGRGRPLAVAAPSGHDGRVATTAPERPSPMPAYPSPDESFARLRRSGWSVGEAAGKLRELLSAEADPVQLAAAPGASCSSAGSCAPRWRWKSGSPMWNSCCRSGGRHEPLAAPDSPRTEQFTASARAMPPGAAAPFLLAKLRAWHKLIHQPASGRGEGLRSRCSPEVHSHAPGSAAGPPAADHVQTSGRRGPSAGRQKDCA